MSGIAVIDYGAGNLESVRNIFDRIGETTEVVTTPEGVLGADRIVLPGVGAAGEALARLHNQGLVQALNEAVREKARPFLGICRGMQLLADHLSEFGSHAGLGWIGGEVVHLNTVVGPEPRVPHMGWSPVAVTGEAEKLFFSAIRGKREFYFSHSYVYQAREGDSPVVATTRHGVEIAAAMLSETVFATQFHPEKSQLNGENLIAAFVDWKP